MCARFWGGRKPEGKNYSKDRNVDGIRIDLREIGWGCGMDSTG
jgi:hypothetical protein